MPKLKSTNAIPLALSLCLSFYIFFGFFLCLQANLTHLPRSQYVPGIGLGIGKCPYDPADNSTAVYVENGNPFGLPALVSKAGKEQVGKGAEQRETKKMSIVIKLQK